MHGFNKAHEMEPSLFEMINPRGGFHVAESPLRISLFLLTPRFRHPSFKTLRTASNTINSPHSRLPSETYHLPTSKFTCPPRKPP